MIDSNIYYSLDKVISYNALLNFLIGERGVGKTFSTKEFVIKQIKKHGDEFVYIRRYKTEIEEALGKNDNDRKFFEQIKSKFPNDELKNTSEQFLCNGKICGYALPLSTANILKGSSFNKVKTIIFDEFIIDKGCYHYLQNEVEQLLDIIETIARLRDIRVLFLGNAISITNPYFNYFNITLPYNKDIKLFKDNLILVNYIRNDKYREVKKTTRFGKLVDGTPYGKYAIDNEFLRDSKSFIQKKTPNCKFYFKVFYKKCYFGIWIDYKEQLMFVSYYYDPSCTI